MLFDCVSGAWDARDGCEEVLYPLCADRQALLRFGFVVVGYRERLLTSNNANRRENGKGW